MKLPSNKLTAILISVFLLAVTISAQDEIIQVDTGSVRQEVIVDSTTSTPGDLKVMPDAEKTRIYKMKTVEKIFFISYIVVFTVILGFAIHGASE